MPKRVLVLCTGNSCRSQMAERLFPLLSDGLWEGVSAGSNPSGYVHPKAIEVMAELGVDLSDGKSEHVDQYSEQAFDLVVTVCDNAAESCPVFPGIRPSPIGPSKTRPMPLVAKMKFFTVSGISVIK